MDAQTIALIIGVLNTLGLVSVAIVNKRSSPAQRDNEIIKNYGELIREYRTRIIELTNEIERVEKEQQEDTTAHEIAMNNSSAILSKRDIEYNQEITRLKNELRTYQIGWAELRRVAVKYVPKEVILPELNGRISTQDVK